MKRRSSAGPMGPRWTFAIGLSLAGLVNAPHAVDAPIAADTFLSAPQGRSPKGGLAALSVGSPGDVAYLRFDLSTMPEGATSADVAVATVRLYVRGVSARGDLVARPVMDGWSEALLAQGNEPPLLDYEASRVSLEVSSAGRFVDLDITELARAWADGFLANHGIALEAGSSGGAFLFDSKESVRGGHEPRMDVLLHTPAGQGTDQPIDLGGPPGPPGPQGPQGPPGASGPALNPMAVALGRWEQANRTGRQVPSGTHPLSAIYEGGWIWVTDFDTDKVAKIDPRTGLTIASYDAGDTPDMAASDGKTLWVANWSPGRITFLSMDDGTSLGSMGTQGGPIAMAFDGVHMWVGNNVSSTIMKIRASTKQVLGIFGVPTGPRRMAFDGKDLWVTCAGAGKVIRVRTTDGAQIATYSGFSTPAGIAFDGTKMWVANNGSASLWAIRISDGQIVNQLSVGLQPFDVAFDGHAIWVTNAGSDTVTKARASDGTILGTYPTGDMPEGIAFDGARIWVANSRTHTLSAY